MNKELKEKWVTALESGKYKQGTDTLFDGVSYCPLGVLCKVAGKKYAIFEEGFISYPLDEGSPWQTEIPPATASAMGLGEDTTKKGGTQDLIMGMNDTDGRSFKEIAEWIRKFL